MSTTIAKSPTFGDAINAVYLTIIHTCMAFQKAAMGTEEIVDLARNEISNLDKHQQIRLDRSEHDRSLQRVELDLELKTA